MKDLIYVSKLSRNCCNEDIFICKMEKEYNSGYELNMTDDGIKINENIYTRRPKNTFMKEYSQIDFEKSSESIGDNAEYKFDENKYEHQTINNNIVDQKIKKIRELCQQYTHDDSELINKEYYDEYPKFTISKQTDESKAKHAMEKLKDIGVEIEEDITEAKIRG